MTEEKDYNENLDNPGDYNSKSDFSKAEIVRQQIVKVNDIRSKEMKAGYFNWDKIGNKVYVPDTRKEFISAVKALRSLLDPEIKRDEQYREGESKIMDRIINAIETFGIYEKVIQGTEIKEETSKPKYIPDLGEKSPIQKFTTRHGQPIGIAIDYIPGLYDRNHHGFWNYLVDCYDEIYSLLSVLIDRLKYFKEEISY